MISAHAMLGFQMADDRFDRRSAPQLAFDFFGDAPLLPRNIDLEAVRWRRVVAAIAAIGDDALEVCADQPLDLGDDGSERVAVIGLARQGLGVDDELPAFRTLQRRRQRRFDAELVWLVRLALADAFHFRRVQAEDAPIGPFPRAFDAAQVLVLRAHAARQHEGMREDILQGLVASDLAHNVANDAAEKGLQRLQRSPRPFELFGVRVALLLDERELADARIGLAQAHAMLFGKPHEALSGAMHQLGVCGEGGGPLLPRALVVLTSVWWCACCAR